MSQFKAGDLALVVAVASVPENLGKCVELVRFVHLGEHAIDGLAGRDCWVIKGDTVGYKRGENIIIGDIGLALEEHLMPLRGQFTPETERETELTQ